ncbi:hypothetical protein ABBQ32_14196 [Trebouxia sp. C0010 RCD-2024]
MAKLSSEGEAAQQISGIRTQNRNEVNSGDICRGSKQTDFDLTAGSDMNGKVCILPDRTDVGQTSSIWHKCKSTQHCPVTKDAVETTFQGTFFPHSNWHARMQHT